jgi:hypothetical protein
MSRIFAAVTGMLLLLMQVIDRPPTETPTMTPYPEPNVYLSDEVIDHVRDIFALGEQLGNRAGVFSKIGDSITTSYQFLYPIGMGQYALGRHSHLEAVIEHYGRVNARDGNSFVNPSLAAHIGWTAFGALDPRNADAEWCVEGEFPIVCEYRLSRPSAALIMFGTNDVGFAQRADFRHNMTRIVQISLGMGVIPIVSTIPDRLNRTQDVERFNQVIRDITDEYQIPLWDYAAAMADLPDHGLSSDGVHPSYPPTDQATTTNFRPPYLDYGYNVRNLTALDMLYAVWWHTQVR